MAQAKTKHKAIRSAGLISLCLSLFFGTSASVALAQESEHTRNLPDTTALVDGSASPGFDFPSLPPIDSIDAQTDVTVFFRIGVPERMRLAALRRVWTVDPAIRDFRGLEELGWDFNDPNAVLGFSDIEPDAYVYTLVARLHRQPPRLPGQSIRQRIQALSFGLLPVSFDRAGATSE